MNAKEQVTVALMLFIRSADKAEIDNLNDSLHENFTNVQNGYFDQPGVHIINKASYVDHVSTGKFGGVIRKINIHFIDIQGDMAMVKATLTNDHLKFHSYISLTREENKWSVIGNFPKIELIKEPQKS